MSEDDFLKEEFDMMLENFDGGLSSTSTRKFEGVIDKFSNRLGIDVDDIYAVSAGTRPTNIPIRLTQGDQSSKQTALGLAYVQAPPEKTEDQIAASAAGSIRGCMVNRHRAHYDNILVVAVKNNIPSAKILLTNSVDNSIENSLKQIFTDISIENLGVSEAAEDTATAVAAG